jgi:hypothetical protein
VATVPATATATVSTATVTTTTVTTTTVAAVRQCDPWDRQRRRHCRGVRQFPYHLPFLRH